MQGSGSNCRKPAPADSQPPSAHRAADGPGAEAHRDAPGEPRAAGESVRLLSRALRVLTAVNRALVRFEEERAFLDEICRICVQEAGYRLAWVGYREGDAKKSIRPVAQAGFEQGYLESSPFSWAETPHGQAPSGRAVRQGRPIACQNILADPHFVEWRDDAARRGYASTLALPLVLDAEVFGVLNIYSDEPADFDADEVDLLVQMAEDLAFGIGVLRARQRRAKTERRLQQTSELLERIFDNVHMLIAYLDTDFNFIRVNQAYARAGGKHPDYFVGKNHFDLFPQAGNEAARRALKMIFQGVLRTGRPYVVFEKPFIYLTDGDRGVTYWDWSLRPVKDPDGDVVGLVLTLVEVTERKRLERMVLEASDREAERIGRDLHDTLGQHLTAMSYRCENLAQDLAQDGRPQAEDAAELAELACQTIREARSLARGLSPVEPGPEGLVGAIRGLAETTAEVFEVSCELDCPEPVPIHDGSAATHLFRIVQEAVNNAVRHAGPSRIAIRLVRDQGGLSLSIADDGDGIPEDAGSAGGMGLHTMQHRASLIGGQWEIEPGENGGTVVRCRLPLPLGTQGERAHA